MRKEIRAIIKHVPQSLLSYREEIYCHLETILTNYYNSFQIVRGTRADLWHAGRGRFAPPSFSITDQTQVRVVIIRTILFGRWNLFSDCLSSHWRPASRDHCQCRGLDGRETLCQDANHLWMTEESANVVVSERSDNIDLWPWSWSLSVTSRVLYSPETQLRP